MYCSSYLTLVVGLAGVVIGWFAIDFFTRRRDKEDRAGAFIGHLLYFRHVIARKAPGDRDGIWAAYLREVPAYHLELGKIRRDFLRDKGLLSLTDKLGNLQQTEILGHSGVDAREPITGRIDKLGQMIEKRKEGWAGESL